MASIEDASHCSSNASSFQNSWSNETLYRKIFAALNFFANFIILRFRKISFLKNFMNSTVWVWLTFSTP